MSYLFGANVEGIQGYLFKTNKLKEIVGASELVKTFSDAKWLNHQGEVLQHAAGGIKIKIDDPKKLNDLIDDFELHCNERFPGMQISSASIAMVQGDLKTSLNVLNQKLREAKQHLAHVPSLPSFADRSRQTGVAMEMVQGKAVDRERQSKTDAAHKNQLGAIFGLTEVTKEIDDIASEKGWVAIIHADGNGLGTFISGMDSSTLKMFSENLDRACQSAVKRAFVDSKVSQEKFRPIVVGGDDVTVICDADRALAFVDALCQAFEQETEVIAGPRLTMCAGVAFVKAHYPFWMGYELAEALCDESKKHSKEMIKGTNELPPSTTSFHFMGSSYNREWDEIKEEELAQKSDHRLFFGPYGVSDSRFPSLEKLCKFAKSLGETKGLKSKLRELLTLWQSGIDPEAHITRMVEVLDGCQEKWIEEVSRNLCPGFSLKTPAPNGRTPIFDLVMLSTHTDSGENQ